MLHFGKTHLGTRKPENQDYIAWNEAMKRFVVADGMSGLARGALASRIVCDAIAGANAPLSLEAALSAAQNALVARAQADGRMGATGIVADFGATGCRLAWLGDCRAYLWRDHALTRLTADHSVEAMLHGGSDRTRGSSSQDLDTVTRYFGGEDAVASFRDIELHEGDWILLCSDGLWRVVSDEQIRNLLDDAESLHDAVFSLVAATLTAGAPDNLSVLLVEPGTCQEARRGTSVRPASTGSPGDASM
jgi:PPM family protein phosphatase